METWGSVIMELGKGLEEREGAGGLVMGVDGPGWAGRLRRGGRTGEEERDGGLVEVDGVEAKLMAGRGWEEAVGRRCCRPACSLTASWVSSIFHVNWRVEKRG